MTLIFFSSSEFLKHKYVQIMLNLKCSKHRNTKLIFVIFLTGSINDAKGSWDGRVHNEGKVCLNCEQRPRGFQKGDVEEACAVREKQRHRRVGIRVWRLMRAVM